MQTPILYDPRKALIQTPYSPYIIQPNIVVAWTLVIHEGLGIGVCFHPVIVYTRVQIITYVYMHMLMTVQFLLSGARRQLIQLQYNTKPYLP